MWIYGIHGIHNDMDLEALGESGGMSAGLDCPGTAHSGLLGPGRPLLTSPTLTGAAPLPAGAPVLGRLAAVSILDGQALLEELNHDESALFVFCFFGGVISLVTYRL